MQTSTQNMFEHGLSVLNYYNQILFALKLDYTPNNIKLPEWFSTYREQLLKDQLQYDLVAEYLIFHDCGKPATLTLDESGKQHFPDHANKSYEIWKELSNNRISAELMKFDMCIHSGDNLDEIIQRGFAPTLLLASLAEVHSNAQMFGGIESTSFKIKWKRINKAGKYIMEKLYGSD